MTADQIETVASACIVAGVLIIASSCTHTVVPIVVVPLVTWTIPLSMTDDARLCVATELAPWVDPADVLPLRCVSIGTIRAWMRAQRMANE
jgi:hypothetical protein